MLNDLCEKSSSYATFNYGIDTHISVDYPGRDKGDQSQWSKIVDGSITEVFLCLEQAASNIFSEKCLGQKQSLLYYTVLNSVFNQAAIQTLE